MCCYIKHVSMPLITTLNIDHSVEMSAVLTTRYRDVRNINLFSLLKGRTLDDFGNEEDDPIELLSVDYDSVLQVIPFLSRFAPIFRKYFLGEGRSMVVLLAFVIGRIYWMRMKIQAECNL